MGAIAEPAAASPARGQPRSSAGGNADTVTPPAPPAAGQGRVVWNVGSLGPKETRATQLNDTADEEGTIRNCLAVGYNPTLCLAVRVVKPELLITKIAPSQVMVCDDITYTYTVTNTGTGTATAVRLEDALPEGDGERRPGRLG